MAIRLDELFDTGHGDSDGAGSPSWNLEVFRRAFCGRDGPFERVCERLGYGFSVLVYLPGNCISAAAAEVTRRYGDAWKEHWKLAEGDQGRTVDQILSGSTSLFDSIVSWLSPGGTKPPKVIFHNLDLLTDGRGALDSGDAAKTAHFYLTETARSGVALGLADRDAGELPSAISRPFAETLWLDEVPIERFFRLIPRKLGEALADSQGVPEGAAWLLASRLRWTDPIRAVRIMDAVARQAKGKGLPGVLAAIMRATRTVEFRNPDDIKQPALHAETGLPTGFEPEAVRLLQDAIIEPFQRWAGFSGSREEARVEVRRLPPGAILWGPPGTGKSLLAGWIAGSTGLPIRQVSAADLKRADWGLTERLVRDLFRSARRAAPCVVVLDDADDLLPDRGSVSGAVASAERGIVNAFLQELQGFGGRLEGVLVILTTNRFLDLDEAARDRLPIRLRIPYPLTREQVEEIVDAVARSYRLVLSEDVHNRLVEHFYRPLTHCSDDVSKEDVRRRMSSNLYSPRQIEAAMQLLIGSGGAEPTIGDVENMKIYFAQAARDAEIAASERNRPA